MTLTACGMGQVWTEECKGLGVSAGEIVLEDGMLWILSRMDTLRLL